jgi:hypothetical protein
VFLIFNLTEIISSLIHSIVYTNRSDLIEEILMEEEKKNKILSLFCYWPQWKGKKKEIANS